MIKFFRKIRQKLLSENKFSKYLLYAIGEIILVIIGILIALQINNSNETKKTFNNELQLYVNILEDLNSEYDIINGHIDFTTRYEDFHLQVYNESKGKSQFNPEKYHNYLVWQHRYNLFFKEKYYESLSTITNNEIHGALKEYINQELITKGTVIDWNNHRQENVKSFLDNNGINDTDAIFNDQSRGLASIINTNNLIRHSKLKDQYGTVEFEQLLFNIRFKTSWMYQNLVWLKDQNRQFKQIIMNEIELHNLTSWQENETSWLNSAKYDQLIDQADEFYNAEEFVKAAEKYSKAFEYKDPMLRDLYDAACTFALAEDIESAFYYLFKSANANYTDLEWMKSDSDLDILHQDKRWNEIIEIVTLNKEEEENKN